MKTIYLKEFAKLAQKGIAYIPIGTVEWHGNYLPVEADFLVAQKICNLVSEDFPGYVLPPIYFGTGKSERIDGQEMRGMDRKLKKILPGNVYFLKPKLLENILQSLVDNLTKQGFKKIIIITGHGGSTQKATLEAIAANDQVLCIYPYESIEGVHHADKNETSIFWACYPEEEAKAKNIMPSANDDLTNYYGYNPFSKSSIALGNKCLKIIVKNSKEQIKDFLRTN